MCTVDIHDSTTVRSINKPSGTCYHIIAAKMSIGMEANDVNVILNMSVLGKIIEEQPNRLLGRKSAGQLINLIWMNQYLIHLWIQKLGQQLDHQETFLKLLPLLQLLGIFQILRKYSRTSIARTPMARLPWLIRTHFWVPTKFFR